MNMLPRNEVAQTVYDFDLQDFGVQPEYSKEDIDGEILVIHGVSEQEFEGEYDKRARSLLHNRLNDPTELAPFGLLLPVDSPAIKQALAMRNRGHVPFYARFSRVASQSHKGFHYWTLSRASVVYNAEGELVDAKE